MSAKELTISGDSAAWQYIEEALAGHYDNDVVELDFESWPQFRINIKGERYHSTLPTSLMKSLVDLQLHLNRVYAEVIYGKSARALTAEERSALEIVFKVEEGSSNILADLSGFFTEFAAKAMDKMTGKQVVGVVLGCAALTAGVVSYSGLNDHEQKIAKEQHRHQESMALLEQYPKLTHVLAEQNIALTNVLKSVTDADKVTVDKAVFNKSQLQAIATQERQTTELKRLDDEYLISSLKIKEESYRIEVIRVSDGKTIQTELFKGHLSLDEMDRIMRAFTAERPIFLKMTARVRDDVITAANIVGLKGEKKESESLAKGEAGDASA